MGGSTPCQFKQLRGSGAQAVLLTPAHQKGIVAAKRDTDLETPYCLSWCWHT
jgi:hypothetical protein